MSTKGVYTALSGAIAQSQRLDTIANNIANINTPAFKKDQQIFKEYLTANEKPPSVIQVPRVPASIDSFYDMQGGDKSFVDSAGTFTNYTQGSLKATGNKLDVAIDGSGFFEIATPQGLRYTRLGAFKMDGNGVLVTKDGYPVLKSSNTDSGPADAGAANPVADAANPATALTNPAANPGSPVAINSDLGADIGTRTFKISGESPVTINDDGEIFDGEISLGKLSVKEFSNKDHLHKVGNSMYGIKKNVTPEISNVKSVSLKQGFLEMSNVNVVQEMTDMIMATRTFESTQKAISTYDSMSDKLINVVGQVK